MKSYNLGFISDEDIYRHVKDTVLQYRRSINLKEFNKIVFGDKFAFFKLCKALPDILDDVMNEDSSVQLVNTVYDELDKTDFYKSIYLLAFNTYEGFNNFQ
jgi:hypothetical protein